MKLVHVWAVAVMVAAALVASGCSSKCGPSNCPGCCDSSGSCQAGTSTTACGIQGVSCSSCGSNACQANGVCTGQGDGGQDAGSCPTPSACPNGCCAGNTCLDYGHQSINACGAGGGACATCTSDGGTATCQGGQCVAGCGPGNCDGCCASSTCIQHATQTTGQCGDLGEVCIACGAGDICTQGLCVLPFDGGTDGGPIADFPCGPYPPCPLSQQCCVGQQADGGIAFSCSSNCQAGDVIGCDGPEECPFNSQYCCGVEVEVGGSSPNCLVSALGATCQASCPTQFASNCQGTNQVVICHTSNDCTADSNSNTCCTFDQSGSSLTFCVGFFLAVNAAHCQ